MGLFLSLSGVIGKTKDQVMMSLSNYAKSKGGGLESSNVALEENNQCIILEAHNNSTILYPGDFYDWDESSQYMSKELAAPVFSFHIHDGDLWMYVFYYKGEIVDQFNPIPDYWDSKISKEELESWKGNASTVVKYVPYVKQSDINQYLVRWNLEDEDLRKAYTDDKFKYEDWQLVDFMRKLRLIYPLDDKGKPTGQIYKLWTEQRRKPQQEIINPGEIQQDKITNIKKPWWKFWYLITDN
jgi:hypothetical protein